MGKLFDRWEKSHKNWLKVAWPDVRLGLFLSALLIITVSSIVIGFKQKHKDEPVQLGVSFSVKYSEDLGNDWKKNFLALSDELHIERMRLMSYWDRIETSNGEYDFSELDWQMDQAQARQIDISLAIGQRQPRWPECHIPGWAKNLSKAEYEKELLEFISTIVNSYKNNPALVSYQLENEAANNLFGECPPFDEQLLNREFALVERLDQENDLIVNASNQSGIPLKSSVGDKLGFSMYQHAYFEALGRQWKWQFDYVPAWWHGLRAALVEGFHGTDAFVHELQTEPWGKVETYHIHKDEQLELMDFDKINDQVNFALDTGMKEVYLWGGEWWYYRKEKFGDKQMWLDLKDMYSYYNASN